MERVTLTSVTARSSLIFSTPLRSSRSCSTLRLLSSEFQRFTLSRRTSSLSLTGVSETPAAAVAARIKQHTRSVSAYQLRHNTCMIVHVL